MKKTLLSLLAAGAVALSAQAKVGDDLTAKYLKNADFSQDEPVVGRICTYDYDMAHGTYLLFGQQAVSGWTALNPSDNIQIMENSGSPAREDGANARAAGVFAIGAYDEDGNHVAELGGVYYVPDFNSNGDEAEGNALGMIAVWQSGIQYTQTVTLPAGCYTIQIPTWNAAGTGTIATNLCGFIADNGKKYVIDKTSYAADAEWMMDEVTFILDEETSGVISLGYTSTNAGSGAMPHLFFDYVKIIEADPAPIIKAEVDALKEQLLPLLEDGDELGVDTKNGWNVYNDDNATLEDVQKAIDDQKEINANNMTDFTDFFLNNAHFNLGTPLDNGVCTYAKDMGDNGTTYFGMQPIPSWTPNNPGKDGQASGLFAVGSGENAWLGSKNQGYVAPDTKADGSTEGNVFGFVGCWTSSSYYTQNVTLPAGSYTITIPTYNSTGGTDAIAKNLCGFIAADGTEYLAETTVFPVNKWSNETIKFTLDEETSGVISIGYTSANLGSGKQPHLFIDEFTLKYNGKLDVDPSLLALQGAVRTAEEYLGTGEYEEALRSDLEAAIAKGQELVTSKSDNSAVNTAAATTLNDLVAEIRVSMTAYEKFDTFVKETLPAVISEYEGNDDMADLKSYLEDNLLSEYESALGDYLYSAKQIEEAIAGLDTVIVEYTQKAFDAAVAAGGEHSINITKLFPEKNLAYADSNVNGWANETGTGAFLSRVQTAEVWNQAAFNVHQTLENMPAGVYEIKANGYYRTAANVDNYPAWQADEVSGVAYIYAGLNQTLMHNVAEYAVEENDGHHGAEVEGMFFSNSNDDAHYSFYELNEAENTVVTALAEAGDLTFGVKGADLSDNAWVVWGGFTVTYKGTVGMEDALAEAVKNLIAEAELYYDDDSAALVDKAGENLDEAIANGKAAIEGTVEQKVAALDELKEAIAYAKNCSSVMAKWMDTRALYNNILSWIDFESESSELDELLGIEPEEGVESIEAVEKIMASFPKAWSAYALGQSEYKAGMPSATEENPFEITDIILNASFEDADSETGMGLNVWNVEKKDGDTGIKENANATYTMSGCDGDYLFNTWNQGTVGYAISQDIYLPAGFYKLTCVVATDAEKTVNVNAGKATALYTGADGVDEEGATIGSKSIGVEMEVVFGSEGEILTVGTSANETWYKVDNFRLYYLGTTAPTGVESVVAKDVLKGAAIYDLSGRKVSKAQKGIYIMNGKKVAF